MYSGCEHISLYSCFSGCSVYYIMYKYISQSTPIQVQCRNFIFLYVLFFFKLINYFIYGCVVSSSLCEGSLQPRQGGATPHRGARASHYCGPSCGAQAPDTQAQQLWPTGPAAPRHAGSSQTRAQTRVPRTGRQTPNHCTTREALFMSF